MKLIVFGATGMVGQGVLLECLRDPRVTDVLVVGRAPATEAHVKMRELIVPDLENLAGHSAELTGFDGCLFCVGVSSVGMDEASYRRVTYDLTLAVARRLAELNPGSTFAYVSGAGTNTNGRQMWARVKGATEDALQELALDVYLFRPGIIIPLDGIKSRVRWYNAVYTATRPVFALIKRLAPASQVTSREIGRAMLAVAAGGYPTRILGNREMHELAARRRGF
ncbi:hypothetical protein [Smaragdicoccus niigatensis]|uniref:hypothetical protein n=1 Tax=Smaragdicoccus niigatensis TaxID=359359 RepID=UPI000378581C|nr:hypothetical protein [Smaragdicoccus niigatensis]